MAHQISATANGHDDHHLSYNHGSLARRGKEKRIEVLSPFFEVLIENFSHEKLGKKIKRRSVGAMIL
jgi:hypothetical protein